MALRHDRAKDIQDRRRYGDPLPDTRYALAQPPTLSIIHQVLLRWALPTKGKPPLTIKSFWKRPVRPWDHRNRGKQHRAEDTRKGLRGVRWTCKNVHKMKTGGGHGCDGGVVAGLEADRVAASSFPSGVLNFSQDHIGGGSRHEAIFILKCCCSPSKAWHQTAAACQEGAGMQQMPRSDLLHHNRPIS